MHVSPVQPFMCVCGSVVTIMDTKSSCGQLFFFTAFNSTMGGDLVFLVVLGIAHSQTHCETSTFAFRTCSLIHPCSGQVRNLSW